MSATKPVRLPGTAIEAAAKTMFMLQHFDRDWEAIEDPGRDLWRHNARELLTAFCESMGFEETVQSVGKEKKPYSQLRSRWRPVEGEDPK